MFLVEAGAAAGALLAGSSLLPETVRAQDYPEDNVRPGREFAGAASRFGLTAEEYRLTEPYLVEENRMRVLYQTVALDKNLSTGEFVMAPLVREFHEKWVDLGIDDPLVYGVALPFPQAFVDDLPSDIQKYLEDHRALISGEVLAYTEYEGMEAWAFENYVVQKFDGRIERSLAGQLAVQVGWDFGSVLTIPCSSTWSESEQKVCLPGPTWVGKASYYSNAGCLGCSPGQIMANGEPFNENAPTLAFMDTPLNVWVNVRNLVTGLEAMGRVTDRGGFKMHDRIADLSLGLAKQIGLQTDQKVEIGLLQC
ncbi:MAG: hypothetical protein A2700_01800 [Candidatus Blackburnbacteria bacterium RIFCSPHIGHO2_01_FULL_44_64]|nr:MAG: hypothetical protein A2700_01800 [Candidatus Blackburnbacteria bacterium RIFCSPHIGHO2_01_FULL_44_64]OGY14869.1 MAG: hypothetical protein A3A62_00720 [Candidatus Blackburnbacteria bacterium RIFCSPLOWO2_01_FULL_44_43]